MKASDLFLSVPSVGKPPKLPADQFEFTIDRKARKIARIYDVFARRETIRVQTNRLFSWSEYVELPDSTLGMTRDVRCVIEVEGAIARDEASARSMLQAALNADFKLDAVMAHLTADAVNQQRSSLGGQFLAVMRDAARRTALIAAVTAVLTRAGLAVERITLTPKLYDEQEFVDLADLPGSLAIRAEATLEAHTVGYKARLAWGDTLEARTAKLIYRGTVLGRSAGPALATPLVEGQIQPVEAWFRTLLAEALARQSWSAVLTGDPALQNALRADVSDRLGRGTGRVVAALDVIPALGALARLPERTKTFDEPYTITGVQGSGLRIQHTLHYGLKDRDRWEAQGKPNPEEVMRPLMIEATRSYLAGKRFEDVIPLFLPGGHGEQDLCDYIRARVGPHADAIGCSLNSNAVILAIPKQEYVKGHPLVFDPAHFSLADPNLRPQMKLSVFVRVAANMIARRAFAAALTDQDTFDTRVRAAVLDAVRSSLRKVNALSYYASHYVNGRPRERDETAPAPPDNVARDLERAVGSALLDEFGLVVERVDLEPGEDELIGRMKALTRLPIPFSIPASNPIVFTRGDGTAPITLEADGWIFIVSIDADPVYWTSFYTNAKRIGDPELQAQALRELLRQTLLAMQGDISRAGKSELDATNVRNEVIRRFSDQARLSFGLIVVIQQLTLRVRRPGMGDTSALVLNSLREELRALLDKRAKADDAGGTYGSLDRRTDLNARIKAIRDEIKQEAAIEDQTIAANETISIAQDRDTGRLIAEG